MRRARNRCPRTCGPCAPRNLPRLPGVAPRDVARMLPFVVALPTATRAQRQHRVARSPGGGLSRHCRPMRWPALVAERARKPFATLSDLRSRLPSGVNIPDETTLGTSSSYLPRQRPRAPGRDARAGARAAAPRRPRMADRGLADARIGVARRVHSASDRGRVNYVGSATHLRRRCPHFAYCSTLRRSPAERTRGRCSTITDASCSPVAARRTHGPQRNAGRPCWRRPACASWRCSLPPLPPDRVAAAAAFALEDQLAGPAEEQHIAVSPQRRRRYGRGDRRQAAAWSPTSPSQFDRILAEPALAPRPPPRHWRWYASGAGGGFVRKPDGSAFATGEHDGVPAGVDARARSRIAP